MGRFLSRDLFGIALLVAARDFGDSLEAVVIPWSVLSMFGSLLGVAIAFVVQSLPWILIPMVAGYLIDIVRKKGLASFLSLVTQAATLAVLAAIPLESLSVAPLAIVVFFLILVVSVCDTLISYFVTVAIPRIVGRDEAKLQEVNSKLSIVSRASRIIGFAVAGPLAYFLSLRALIIDASILIASLPTLAKFTPWNKISDAEVSNYGRGGERIAIPKCVKYLIVTVIPFNYAVGPWRIFVINSLSRLPNGLGSISYSLVNVALIIAGLLSSVVMLKYVQRCEPRKFLYLGLVGEVFFVASLASLYVANSTFATLTAMAIAAVSLLGFMDPLINVSLNSVLQSRIDSRYLGRVRGVFDTVATLAITVSELATAYLLQHMTTVNAYLLPITYSLICLGGALASIEALKEC